MSTLTLVRHGQALPYLEDSDRLSDLGRRQAQALAEYWLRPAGTVGAFDELVCGSLRRQIETAEILRASMPRAALRQDPRFNEYDSAGIHRELAPRLAETNQDFAALWKGWQANRGAADQNRHFQSMFQALLQGWCEDGLIHPHVEPHVESWPVFHARVQDGLKDILQGGGRSRRVVVVTSGGPIGVAVQTAVGAPPSSALNIHWRTRNCSLTGFLFTEGKLSLDYFNATPHLTPELESFR